MTRNLRRHVEAEIQERGLASVDVDVAAILDEADKSLDYHEGKRELETWLNLHLRRRPGSEALEEMAMTQTALYAEVHGLEDLPYMGTYELPYVPRLEVHLNEPPRIFYASTGGGKPRRVSRLGQR
jgi:hypothetical protein